MNQRIIIFIDLSEEDLKNPFVAEINEQEIEEKIVELDWIFYKWLI